MTRRTTHITSIDYTGQTKTQTFTHKHYNDHELNQLIDDNRIQAFKKNACKFLNRPNLWDYDDSAQPAIYHWNEVIVHEKIRSGSFSTILKVSCHKSGHKYLALKAVPEVGLDNRTQKMATNALKREAFILSQLSHSNIIQLHGVITPESCDGRASRVLLLDLLQETLYDRLKSWKRTHQKRDRQRNRFLAYTSRHLTQQPPSSRHDIPTLYDRMLMIGYKICEAVKYLHEQRIVHCNIKPSNIGFDHKNCLKLFDFGMSQDLLNEDENSDGSSFVGSCRYLAPEILMAQPIGTSADTYSLALLFWELGSLKTPFQGVKKARDIIDLVAKREERPDIFQIESKRFQNLLIDMWASNPRQRPTLSTVQSTFAEVLSEIRAQKECNLNAVATKKQYASNKRLWRFFPKQLSVSTASTTECHLEESSEICY